MFVHVKQVQSNQEWIVRGSVVVLCVPQESLQTCNECLKAQFCCFGVVTTLTKEKSALNHFKNNVEVRVVRVRDGNELRQNTQRFGQFGFHLLCHHLRNRVACKESRLERSRPRQTCFYACDTSFSQDQLFLALQTHPATFTCPSEVLEKI